MLWRHEEIARLRRVVGRLFRDIVAFRVVRVFPGAGKRLTKDRIKWLLNASADLDRLAYTSPPRIGKSEGDLRWFDVPSTQIKLHHRHKPLLRVLNLSHRQQRLRVRHEAILCQHHTSLPSPSPPRYSRANLLRNPLQHAPRL